MAKQASLGFIYVTDLLEPHLPDILVMLRARTGIAAWSGSIGLGVAATGVEYFDQAAMVILAASLPEDSWHLMANVTEPGTVARSVMGFARGAAKQAGALGAPSLGIVHADPRNPAIAGMVAELANAMSGYLVGGLASSRGAPDQIAGEVVSGGLSGVLFSPGVAVSIGLSQGCSPIGPVRSVTASRQNVLIEIDGRPALDVLKEDIGDVLSRRLERVANYIHAAFPVSGSDTGDYLVRNLVGLDVERGWVAVGHGVQTGDRILFVRRDRQAAEDDLVRMLQRLKRSAPSPKAGLYFTCLARGPNLFGPESAELRILQRELGDFPLVGMFCNGEICNDRLYGYTGVLTLFL